MFGMNRLQELLDDKMADEQSLMTIAADEEVAHGLAVAVSSLTPVARKLASVHPNDPPSNSLRLIPLRRIGGVLTPAIPLWGR